MLQRGAADTHIIQIRPSSTTEAPSDEEMVDADEPPDDAAYDATPKTFTPKPTPAQRTAGFAKKTCQLEHKQSLLTQMMHTSESDSNHEDENIFSDAKRAHSNASTWSRCSAASTAELTSDGHTSPARSASPSPPTPSTQVHVLPPVFNPKPFNTPSTIKFVRTEPIDPLHKPAVSSNEQAVEAGLGRKRRIAFACGGREVEERKAEPPKEENVKPAELAKRPCALKFVCPTRDNAAPAKPLARPTRLMSPPPPAKKLLPPPKANQRSHRGSDSTVRNDSPKSVRKVPVTAFSKQTQASEVMGVDEPTASSLHESASSEEEEDDRWTQESTCHRSRLTVSDTLKVENQLRKIGAEAEEEALQEEEEEEDNDDIIDEEDDEERDDDMDDAADDYSTDEGFQTDDEEGFANTDDESDAGSDYAWWTPGRGRSAEPVEHIRPSSRRTNSNSSIGSYSSANVFPAIKIQNRRRKSPMHKMHRPRTPELPDSTDFVCGTLDEDRPLEVEYLTQLERRRAAKHKAVPQDIDPTFPTSDPEMDEEDEDSEHDVIDESDHHFMHGHMDMHEDVEMGERQPSGIIPKKRSPPHSPKRLRSPPPAKRKIHRSPPPPMKRNMHRSPPPRRLFGQSPRHARSPPPLGRQLRSPPPTRRTSFTTDGKQQQQQQPVGLASRPQLGLASSVPRNGAEYPRRLHPPSEDEDEGLQTPVDALHTRGAIDIVKGLEKKRQRRREKMCEKQCRNKIKKAERMMQPGKGCEKMREVGMELAAYRGKRPPPIWPGEPLSVGDGKDAQHILSY